VNAAVSAAVTAAEGSGDNWESQQTTLQNQTSALTSLQTDATNLDNDMQALNSLDRSIVRSDSELVKLQRGHRFSGSGSAAGNNVVVVNSLATTASYSSSAVASATTDLPTGETITITPADGHPDDRYDRQRR
jgi:flagellar capping protein FliD